MADLTNDDSIVSFAPPPSGQLNSGGSKNFIREVIKKLKFKKNLIKKEFEYIKLSTTKK